MPYLQGLVSTAQCHLNDISPFSLCSVVVAISTAILRPCHADRTSSTYPLHMLRYTRDPLFVCFTSMFQSRTSACMLKSYTLPSQLYLCNRQNESTKIILSSLHTLHSAITVDVSFFRDVFGRSPDRFMATPCRLCT